MNTPSHTVLNLAFLLPLDPTVPMAIAIGSVLPDVPMFLMYGWAKLICRQPEAQIWRETYWQPGWQTWNHLFHSIPLAAIALVLASWWQAPAIALGSASVLLHCLGDLPVHHDDAHRHFLPFSHYRFISPISYWDPKHHGRTVALVEKLMVLCATLALWPQLEAGWGKALLLVINGIYLSSYGYRVLFRRCVPRQAE